MSGALIDAQAKHTNWIWFFKARSGGHVSFLQEMMWVQDCVPEFFQSLALEHTGSWCQNVKTLKRIWHQALQILQTSGWWNIQNCEWTEVYVNITLMWTVVQT